MRASTRAHASTHAYARTHARTQQSHACCLWRGRRQCGAGMVAAITLLPVVGVPVKTSTLSGNDSLLSIVQMPAGIPVRSLLLLRTCTHTHAHTHTHTHTHTHQRTHHTQTPHKHHLSGHAGLDSPLASLVGRNRRDRQREERRTPRCADFIGAAAARRRLCRRPLPSLPLIAPPTLQSHLRSASLL